MAPEKHATGAPSDWSRECSTIFTGKTGFRGSRTPNGAETHPARRRMAPRGDFGAHHPLQKRPTRQNLAGNYAAKCFCRRGGAPRCAGSGRMKLGKLGLPRPTAPQSTGTHPAWRLPTPSCEFMTRYPVRKMPTRQTLAEKYGVKCPPPAWGGAPLHGVELAVWLSRWVTGGPDLLRRLANRRTRRRAAPNANSVPVTLCEKHPSGRTRRGATR